MQHQPSSKTPGKTAGRRAATRRRSSLPLLALNIAIVMVLAGGTAAYGALSQTVTLTVENRSSRVVRWLADGCRVPVSASIRYVGVSWIGGVTQTGIAAQFKELALRPLLQNGFAALGAEFNDPMQGQPLQAGGGDRGLRRPPAQDRGLGDAAAGRQLVQGEFGVALRAE